MIRKLTYTFFLLILCSTSLFAQQKSKQNQKPKSQIMVMARVSKKDNLINIRWGTSDAQAWKLSNKYGFNVERFTILRDKKMLAQPERKLIARH